MNFIKTDLSHAYSIRRAFTEKYVDKSLVFYRYSMGHGDFYGSASHRSCMWETFKSYNVISRRAALNIIRHLPEIFITWDRSPASISRKLQKSRMIQMTGADFVNVFENPYAEIPKTSRNSHFRPSDIYVFTPDLSCYVAFTHRSIDGIGDICLTSVDDIADSGVPECYHELFECFRNSCSSQFTL